VLHPVAYLSNWFFMTPPIATCISNIFNIPITKKIQAITGVRLKSLQCPQLDHHDADGLTGHKTFYIWDCFCTPLVTWNFSDFTISIFIFNLLTCIRTTSRSTDVQQITSLYQIAYVQRILCIKIVLQISNCISHLKKHVFSEKGKFEGVNELKLCCDWRRHKQQV
jgi:hypothetical protein